MIAMAGQDGELAVATTIVMSHGRRAGRKRRRNIRRAPANLTKI
jgi:hypothetical protein